MSPLSHFFFWKTVWRLFLIFFKESVDRLPTTLPACHPNAENHAVTSHHFLCSKEPPWISCHCDRDRACLPTEQEQMNKRREKKRGIICVGLQSLNWLIFVWTAFQMTREEDENRFIFLHLTIYVWSRVKIVG